MKKNFILLFFILQLNGLQAILFRGVTPQKTNDFILFEDFENKIPWNISKKYPTPVYARFIVKEPIFFDKKNTLFPNKTSQSVLRNAFLQELNYIKKSYSLKKRQPPSKPQYSYELMIFFQHPGKETIEITKKIPIGYNPVITGRPIALSVWIHSQNNNHKLVAIFKNKYKKKIPVMIGKLNFKGWERFEISLPYYVYRRNIQKNNSYEFEFSGFQIRSHASEDPGNFIYLIDNVVLLVDTSEAYYPGAKIKDNWK